MTRILVTGAGGYLGGCLLQGLATDPTLALRVTTRRALLPAAPLAERHPVDWQRDDDLKRLCTGVDGIIHLLAMGEQACRQDPEAALRVNGVWTWRLLSAAVAAGVKRFLYVSTAKVFGDQPNGPIDETTLPRPVSSYAITHRLAEDYVLACRAQGSLEGVVLRLTNSVGAPADTGTEADALIANDVCRQAVTTGRIVLRSSGLAWRNFIAMADGVAALRHLMNLPGAELRDGLFHLGGPQSWCLGQLADLVASRAEAMLGRTISIERPAPAPDEHHPGLDWRITKLMETGWRPVGSLAGEIDGTLRFYHDRIALQ